MRDNTNKGRAFRASRALLNHLELAPVTSDQVWDYLKEYFGVNSSKDMSEKQMVMLEARLRAASKDRGLLQVLITKVSEYVMSQLTAYDVITKGKETQYVLVRDVSAENLQEWAQDRANEKGHPVHLQNTDKVVVFRAEPSELFLNPDVDGQIAQVAFYAEYFTLCFNGSDKPYKYDKLNPYQMALCRLFVEHVQFDEMYKFLTQVRLSYQAQMADMI